MPKLQFVTVDDTKYEVLAQLESSRIKNPEHTKSLYFGSDTILQNGQHLLICRKVIDVEFEMIEK